MSEQKERAVVVTTKHRGVFFGYATDTDGDIDAPEKIVCGTFKSTHGHCTEAAIWAAYADRGG